MLFEDLVAAHLPGARFAHPSKCSLRWHGVVGQEMQGSFEMHRCIRA
jgi:hypothetical protein